MAVGRHLWRKGTYDQDATSLSYRPWHTLHTRAVYQCTSFTRNNMCLRKTVSPRGNTDASVLCTPSAALYVLYFLSKARVICIFEHYFRTLTSVFENRDTALSLTFECNFCGKYMFVGEKVPPEKDTYVYKNVEVLGCFTRTH
jgi:hypothetical protein